MQDGAANGADETGLPSKGRRTWWQDKTDGMETAAEQHTMKKSYERDGTLGEQRTTKRCANGRNAAPTAQDETENDTDGTEMSDERRTKIQEAGIEQACDEKETSEEPGRTLLAEYSNKFNQTY